MVDRKRRNQYAEQLRHFAARVLLDESIWSPQTPALKTTELPGILIEHSVIVMHFWASWNRIDQQFDATLQQVRPDYADTIAFFAVDIDDPDNRELCTRYNVTNIPALSCFVKGKWQETSIGAHPASYVRSKLDEWLSRSSSALRLHGHPFPHNDCNQQP